MTQIIDMQVSEVEIPIEMFSRPLRSRTVHIYALSKKTLGISFRRAKDWEGKALWTGVTNARKTKDSLVVNMPDELASFYNMRQDNFTISVSEKTNNIQIDTE